MKLKNILGQALYQRLFNGRPILPLVSTELLKLADTTTPKKVSENVYMLALADKDGVTRVLLFGRLEDLQQEGRKLPGIFYTTGGCWAFPNLALKTIVHVMPWARSGQCLVGVPVCRVSSEATHDEIYNDYLQAYDLFAADTRIDSVRTVGMGHSSGGQMIGKLAVVRSFKLLVLWSAPLDPRKIRFFNKESVISYFFAKKVLGIRPKHAPASCSMFGDLEAGLGEILCPVLVMHGQNDFAVDHQQSVDGVKQLRELGVDVEFVSLPGVGHYIAGEEACVRQVYDAVNKALNITVAYTTTAKERELQESFRLLKPLLS